MGWLARSAPRGEHESCSREIRKLEERITKLEERDLEHRLQVMDYAEKLAHRLQDRTAKREDKQPERAPRPWELRRGIQSP